MHHSFPQALSAHPDFCRKPILNTEPLRTKILVLLPPEAQNRQFLYQRFNWVRQLRSVSDVTVVIEKQKKLVLAEVSPAISAIKILEEDVTIGNVFQNFGAIFTDLDLTKLENLEEFSIAIGVPIFTPKSNKKRIYKSSLFEFDHTRKLSARNILRAFLANPLFFVKELRKLRRSLFRERSTIHPTASVITCTNRPEDLSNTLENFARQTYGNLDLILGLHGSIPISPAQQSRIDQLGSRIQIKTIKSSASLGSALNELVALCTSEYVLRFDSDDWYGENYVQDTLIDLKVTGADIIGKRYHFSYLKSIDATILLDNTSDQFIAGPTFSGPLTTFTRFPFDNITNGEDTQLLKSLIERDLRIENGDRYNFLAVRQDSLEKHTHKVSNLAYLAIGTFLFSGFATDQIKN